MHDLVSSFIANQEVEKGGHPYKLLIAHAISSLFDSRSTPALPLLITVVSTQS
jgi:hypothetical protein